jgi:hypothetical protein
MLFTKAGALVFSREAILGMEVNEISKLTVLDEQNKASYFFPWSDYKMIQTGKKVMYSLNNDLVVRNLTWKAEELHVVFNDYVRVSSQQKIEANITKIKEELKNVTDLAVLDYSPNFMGLGISRKNWTDFVGLFSFISTLLSILGIIALCCYKRLKKNNRLVKLIMDTLHQEKQEKRARKYARPLHVLEESLEDDISAHKDLPTVKEITYHPVSRQRPIDRTKTLQMDDLPIVHKVKTTVRSRNASCQTKQRDSSSIESSTSPRQSRKPAQRPVVGKPVDSKPERKTPQQNLRRKVVTDPYETD